MLNTANKNIFTLILICSTLSTVSTYAAEANPDEEAKDEAAVVGPRPFILSIDSNTEKHNQELRHIMSSVLTSFKRLNKFLKTNSPFIVRETVCESRLRGYHLESWLTMWLTDGDSIKKIVTDPIQLCEAIAISQNLNLRPHLLERVTPLYRTLSRPLESHEPPEWSGSKLAEILVQNQQIAQTINLPCRLPNGETETPFACLLKRYVHYGAEWNETNILESIGSNALVNLPHFSGNCFPIEWLVRPRAPSDLIFKDRMKTLAEKFNETEDLDTRYATVATFLARQGAHNIIISAEGEGQVTRSCYDLALPFIQEALDKGWNDVIVDNPKGHPRKAISKDKLEFHHACDYGNQPLPPGIKLGHLPEA